MECSAKDNYNVTELFKTLLSLSKIIPTENNDTFGGPLKRRSSAYYSGKGRQSYFREEEIGIVRVSRIEI